MAARVNASAILRSVPLAAASAACALCSLFASLHAPVNDDDVYHLHSIWLVAHGVVPYREFFEIHPPGLWVVLSPFAAWFTSPSHYLLAARALIAAMVGLMVWLAGSAIQARGAQAVVLGVLVLGIIGRCQIWMFRVEYIAAVLLLLHVWLLAGTTGREPGMLRALLAAASVALGCTMSVRLLPFVAIQPLALLWASPRSWRRQGALWFAGVLIGAFPAAVYLTAHGLWADGWFWAVRFVSSSDVVSWGFEVGRADLVLVALGLAGAVLAWQRGTFTIMRRASLIASWGVAVAFHLSNPHKVDFAGIYLLLTTAMLVGAVVPLISARRPPIVRDSAIVAVAVALIFFARVIAGVSLPAHRQVQRLQLSVLDWLGEVAGDEGVVLVVPYHPMTVPDATDLQNAWYYSFWLGNAAVHRRLVGFGEAVLTHPPPVMAANPWPERTGGLDLPTWLADAAVLTFEQRARIQALVAERYARVTFPTLGTEQGLPFGDAFWVRRDRLDAHAPPTPSVVLERGP